MDATDWVAIGSIATAGLAAGTFWLGWSTRGSVKEMKAEGQRSERLVAANKEQAGEIRQLAATTSEQTKLASDQVALGREQLEVIRQQVDLAREQAEVAERQAEIAAGTLEHLRREQEIAMRPRLVVTRFNVSGFLGSTPRPIGWDWHRDPEVELDVTVMNVGRGTAVDVLVTQAEQNSFRYGAEPVSIGPGSELTIRISAHGGGPEGVYQVRTIPQHLFTFPSPGGGREYNPGPLRHVLCCMDESGERVYRFASGIPGYGVWRLGEAAPLWASDVNELAPHLRPI